MSTMPSYRLVMALDILASSKVELSDATTVCSLGKISPQEYEVLDSIAARNACVVGMVHAVVATDGVFAGWEFLACVASNIQLPTCIVMEAVRGTKLYADLRPAAYPKRAPSGLRVVITRTMPRDSNVEISPKTIGGKGWMYNESHRATLQEWSNGSGFLTNPSIAFGFLGIQRKVISSRADMGDYDTLMYLGALVDYDLDTVDQHSVGFANAMSVAAKNVANIGSRLQGAALCSLLNSEIQQHNRVLQRRWIADRLGSLVHGAADISADDWVIVCMADSGGTTTFGYEPAAAYPESRQGLFAAVQVSSLYDLVYDRVTSGLATPMIYTMAAGMTHHNMHCIFGTTIVDAIAKRISCLDEDANPLYGDSALIVSLAWAPFSIRYHTWERFVKYSRQITKSTDSDVQNVAAVARQSLALPCDDFAETWRQAMMRMAARQARKRSGSHVDSPYHCEVHPNSCAGHHQLSPATLCSACTRGFAEALDAFELECSGIQAVEGMPMSAIQCDGVAIAAAIYRACAFATSTDCCDVCACRIGYWADEASTEVVLALMRSEPQTPAVEWLMQCYIVGCVPLAPVSVPSILTGFDLLCDIKEHDRAMGCRDVLDI
ncbi:hypothetical protein C8R45DRAFT_916597 [Mycena sanguinolenta]|nr:hypothetical protein C8R45DRAFT_916597 [Mycena sanguinolenta]